MRNIRKFETYDEFLAAQESVSGSGAYVEDVVPGFAYIKELYMAGKACTFYNKKARAGDRRHPLHLLRGGAGKAPEMLLVGIYA